MNRKIVLLNFWATWRAPCKVEQKVTFEADIQAAMRKQTTQRGY
jgi:thiol:disulfide interchange protein